MHSVSPLAYFAGLANHCPRLAIALALPAILACAPQAQAGPNLYASSFVVNVSQAECIKDTRQALIQAGMLQQGITSTTFTDKDGKNVQIGWSADHPSENISALFECDARNGTGAMAVSGGNNEITYKFFQKLWDTWIK